jgi:hypothetical protein
MLLGVPCAMSRWRMPRRHVVCVQAVHPLDDRSSERDLLPAALMCARCAMLCLTLAQEHTLRAGSRCGAGLCCADSSVACVDRRSLRGRCVVMRRVACGPPAHLLNDVR